MEVVLGPGIWAIWFCLSYTCSQNNTVIREITEICCELCLGSREWEAVFGTWNGLPNASAHRSLPPKADLEGWHVHGHSMKHDVGRTAGR